MHSRRRRLPRRLADLDLPSPAATPSPDALPMSSPQNALNEARFHRAFTDLRVRLERGEHRKAYGRDAEIAEVLRLLQSPLPRHPVLLGRAGVGKTSVMLEIADLIRRGSG